MSSVLALALMAGAAAQGNVPEKAAGETDQRLDLRGDWGGTWHRGGGGTGDAGQVHLSGTRIEVSAGGVVIGYEHRILDEGQNRLRFNAERPGIYRQDGDRLVICFGEPGRGRPHSFRAGDGQTLLILRRVRPGK